MLAAAAVALVPATAAAAPSGFVVADGAKFAVSTGAGTEPWVPVGYNQYRLTARPGGYVCDSGFGPASEAELGSWMDQMRASGANVVRTWFFQSMYDADGAGPGAGSWAAFDRVLDAARARGIRVIPVLVNHWADCEPSGAAKTVGFYGGGFRQDSSYGYSLSYKNYATKVASHYRDDPAIAFWQLANEAEAPGGSGCDENAAAAALRGFATEMSAAVHGADPNHLVSLGTMGSGQCGGSSDNYRSINEPVDICEIHDYDHAAEPMPGDAWNGLAQRLAQCGPGGLNKPIFVGESGIAADVDSAGNRTGTISASSLQARAGLIEAKIEAQFAAGMDGYLLWERIREPSDSSFNSGARGPYGAGPGDPIEDVLRRFGQPGSPLDGGWAPAGGRYASAVTATAGLEGYWRLGEPAGMKTAVASAGAVDGSYAPAVLKGAGLIGSDPDSAAVFRAGAAGSIAFGDQADFPARHAFTLEAWIQPAKASRKRVGGPVISKLQKHWGGYALETTGRGRLSFSLSRGKRPATVYGPRLAAGERHHVVASFDGRTMRICVDGSCGSGWARSASRRLVDNAAPLLVGRQGRSAFAGTIDEVAVYGLALTPEEVAAHAAAGA